MFLHGDTTGALPLLSVRQTETSRYLFDCFFVVFFFHNFIVSVFQLTHKSIYQEKCYILKIEKKEFLISFIVVHIFVFFCLFVVFFFAGKRMFTSTG